MSRLLRLSPLLVLLTCSPAEEGVLPVRVRRDPGPIAVSAAVANGDMPGARLGTTVVVCDGEGMASGVTGQVWGEFSLFGQPNAPQASVLSCRDTGTHEYLAGGSNGLSSIIPPASSWDTFIDAGVQSIDRRPSDTTLLIARGLNVDVFGSTTGGLLGYRAKAVRWGPGGRSFAVVTDNEVKLYAFTPGLLMVPVMGVFIPPQNRTFDDGVTIGEFNLRSGLEVAVTLSQGGVAVYNQSFNTPLYVIAEGSSVATDENWLGSLDSLLVGEPQNELVRRWVGDAAVEDWYLDGGGQTEFGYAIAIRATNDDKFFGAPGHNADHGAVYLIDTPSQTPLGVEQECDVQRPCFPRTGIPGQCTVGVCLGGVVCAATMNACPMGTSCTSNSDMCVPSDDAGVDAGLDGGAPDAGAPDAGALDAGELDAGEVDAGQSDAGARDAGAAVGDGGVDDRPYELGSKFDAIACSSCASVTGGDALLLAACAWLLSRRRRATA